MSVNLSARQLEAADVTTRVADAVARAGRFDSFSASAVSPVVVAARTDGR